MNQKIAIYIPLLNFGGAERVVLDLLCEFAKEGEFDVHLITDAHSSVLIKQVPSTLKIIHLQCAGFLNKFSKILKLRRLLKEYNFDFIISNLTHANIHMAFVKLISIDNNCKLILVEHNVVSHYIYHLKNIVKKLLLWFFVLVLYRVANRIVCVSNSVKEDLEKTFYLQKSLCEVIYNPIDVAKILLLKNEPIDSEVAEFIKDKKVLISVGRLVPQKNHALLLQAFFLLKNSNYVLLIVGDGALRSDLEKYVFEKNISNSVKFLGYQTNPYKYIVAADILVLTSIFEGFGLVLVEAMLLGTQIVAVKGAAVIEIVNLMQTGYLSSNDPQDLAREILLASFQDDQLSDYENRITSSFGVKHVYRCYKDLLAK
jgi:glycosyltransferase involved in cell wall biosynthesis